MSKRRKPKFLRLVIVLGLFFAFIYFVVLGHVCVYKKLFSEKSVPPATVVLNFLEDLTETKPEGEILEFTPYYPKLPSVADAKGFSSKVTSPYAILIDATNSKVLCSREGKTRIYPASMTKVMTVLVAAEHIKNLDEKFKMSFEVINPLCEQNATVTGFISGEEVTLRDLFYGAILPSGADATISLAEYVSGSEEAFVDLMNEKAKDLGLRDTHFTNTSGLHDDNHYTTPYDMAIIMEATMNCDFLRKVLQTQRYFSTPTDEHPDGVEMISTMFGRIHSNEVDGVTIIGGKTGYTAEAGQCMVSMAEKDNTEYILVTSYGVGKYAGIYDCIEVYGKHLP